MDVLQTVTSVQRSRLRRAGGGRRAQAGTPLAHHTVSDDAVTVHGEICAHVTNNDDASVYATAQHYLKRFLSRLA
jgi:hypothetical protein